MNLIVHLIREMRPKQWTKNLFVFVVVVVDQKLFVPGPFFGTPLGRSVLGFVLLCVMSGAVYVLNDIIDVEQDRAHPTKRNRPIASGALPMGVAWRAVGPLARDKRDDPATESHIPLPAMSQFVVDTERLWHAVYHPGPEPRYALITSFESSDPLQRWINANRA